MSHNELTNKVHELRELRRFAAEIDAQITALQESIKNHMETMQIEEISGIDWRITWKTVESTRFDKAAMVHTFGQNCYDGFCRPIVTQRFVLS